MDDVETVTEALTQANRGFALYTELLAAGWPQGVVDRHVRGLHRIARGAYALTLPEDPRERHLLWARALLRTRWSQHCLSHLTAALWWDLPLLVPTPAQVHLTTLTETNGRARGSIRLHGQVVGGRDLVRQNGVVVTSPTRTVLDCARTLATIPATAIADAALHRGLTSKRRLSAALKAMKGWTGVGMARAVLARAEAAAESPGETWCRLVLRQVGFPLRSQVVVRDGRRFVARADLQIQDTWVLVEFDGRVKYGAGGDAESALWAEKRRHDALVRLGYEVVRVTWADLHDRDALRETVRAAVHRSGQRHGSAPPPN